MNNLDRFRRREHSVEEYLAGIRAGNRVLLSQAITLIESRNEAHQAKAQDLIECCLPLAGNAVRVGITGTPGVGKSTFIEAFGNHLIAEGKKVAVLAIDPSSQLSRGSILGDKTRMATLAAQPDAFIRPSPAGDSLGGVARKTRETIVLCEAAGFDAIVVETVGVGQSETAVHSMVDFFLLLLLPNAGDELQGIKRGVMEMADLVVINKADGAALDMAKLARQQCNNALHLFPAHESGWTARALLCSALHQTGIADIWQKIVEFQQMTQVNGYWQRHRDQQSLYWLHESIQQQLQARLQQLPRYHALQTAVREHRLSPFRAGEILLKEWLGTGYNDPH